jgi:CubicO group peptidase (beta-lactamase class C family)
MQIDDIFDVASLTKPLVTTSCVMQLVLRNKLSLNTELGELGLSNGLQMEVPDDKKRISIRHLLTHSAGFQAYYPFFKEYDQTQEKEIIYEKILSFPLVYRPGEVTIYSDLGFILIEMIVTSITNMSMEEQFYEIFRSLALSGTFFSRSVPREESLSRVVPTEYCHWRRRLIRGVVHDETAFLMGGYSGHAGLFSSLDDIYGIMLRLYKNVATHSLLQQFWEPQRDLGGGERAIGWDTPSGKDSSTVRSFSPETVGHLGFTGCSLWLDLKRELLVVLLTNRVHPTRLNEKIRQFRPLIHDAIVEELGLR